MKNGTNKKRVNLVVNDYGFVVSGNAYTPPECRRFHLYGQASWVEDPAQRWMYTSPIVSVRGNVVTTSSGSRYVLGTRAKDCKSLDELRKENPGVPMGRGS